MLSMLLHTIVIALHFQTIIDIKILPSGSKSRVTPYSFSTTWNAVSRRSRGRADLAFRQSSKSGRLRWMSAENAKPSRQEPVKSFT